MTDDQNPHDADGTDPGMTYAEWKTGGVPKVDAASAKDRADVRAVLAVAVAEAPPAPSVEEIAARVAVRSSAPAHAVPEQRSVSASPMTDSAPDAGAEGGPGLAPYVVGDGSGPGGGRAAGTRWPRIVLAAAVVLALVGLGIAVNRSWDDPTAVDVASEPGVATPAGAPVAAVPTAPPLGYALIWVSDTAVGGRASMLRYGSDLGLEPLVVASTVVEPGSDVPETGESGSIERWGDRDVTVDEDGRRARFVDPAGLLVEVTGEPADVAVVVPVLVLHDAEGWKGFLDQMSADIAALPVVASEVLLQRGLIGTLGPGGATAIEQVDLALHGGPETSAGSSGAIAGTCLTVDGSVTCRPTDPMSWQRAEGSSVQTSVGVLVDGSWWEVGWATEELTGVEMTAGGWPPTRPSTDADMGETVQVHFATADEPGIGPMSWFAAMLPDDAESVTVEVLGSGGFQQVRPAT